MKLVHVTIRTKYFEEEIRFYEKFAGLQIRDDMRQKGRNIVFLSNADGETCIEIIEEPASSDAGNPYLSIGFQTEDAEKKREELMTQGYEPTPLIAPMPQVKFFFVSDPAGARVQFIEE